MTRYESVILLCHTFDKKYDSGETQLMKRYVSEFSQEISLIGYKIYDTTNEIKIIEIPIDFEKKKKEIDEVNEINEKMKNRKIILTTDCKSNRN